MSVLDNAWKELDAQSQAMVDSACELIRIPSENPPSDTAALVDYIVEYLGDVADLELTRHCRQAPVSNLFARVRGRGAGSSLAFNGHLDTYPTGPAEQWSASPFSGHVSDGRIYGRGACDMKGGIACALQAFKTLARYRDEWRGELVLTLAGDEESMGVLGTQAMLEDIPGARTHAMLCADVGSPQVVRVGEKGMLWVDVQATGRAAHGAHVHRGISAIDRLRDALDRLVSLRAWPVQTPPEVEQTIQQAKAVSEPLAGEGESDVMRSVTVNIGHIDGGISPNLVASHACARTDVRLPLGVSVADIESAISQRLSDLEGVSFTVHRRYEPSWTSPSHPFVAATLAACQHVLGESAVANMRIGASDARLYRAAGIPTVVCGLSPNNLGAPDEFAIIDEMRSLARIHVAAALRFLA